MRAKYKSEREANEQLLQKNEKLRANQEAFIKLREEHEPLKTSLQLSNQLLAFAKDCAVSVNSHSSGISGARKVLKIDERMMNLTDAKARKRKVQILVHPDKFLQEPNLYKCATFWSQLCNSAFDVIEKKLDQIVNKRNLLEPKRENNDRGEDVISISSSTKKFCIFILSGLVDFGSSCCLTIISLYLLASCPFLFINCEVQVSLCLESSIWTVLVLV